VGYTGPTPAPPVSTAIGYGGHNPVTPVSPAVDYNGPTPATQALPAVGYNGPTPVTPAIPVVGYNSPTPAPHVPPSAGYNGPTATPATAVYNGPTPIIPGAGYNGPASVTPAPPVVAYSGPTPVTPVLPAVGHNSPTPSPVTPIAPAIGYVGPVPENQNINFVSQPHSSGVHTPEAPINPHFNFVTPLPHVQLSQHGPSTPIPSIQAPQVPNIQQNHFVHTPHSSQLPLPHPNQVPQSIGHVPQFQQLTNQPANDVPIQSSNLVQIHQTNHPIMSTVQFSQKPGPNPILTGVQTNDHTGPLRSVKTTHILSDFTPPPGNLNNVQINGLTNQELHSMMAFVHTMQSTPESVHSNPNHIHNNIQTSTPLNPGLILSKNDLEPTPRPSLINRPLFDPLRNNPSNHGHQSISSSNVAQPQPHNSLPPLLPHPQLPNQVLPPITAVPDLHSTPGPKHTFAVKDHQHPPMMPALAGTTTSCQQPDGNGGYSCVTFHTTEKNSFTFNHGSRIKRKELNPKIDDKGTKPIESSLDALDFNLVLSPKSTQFLKQVFQTNNQNSQQFKRNTALQGNQIPSTPNVLTPGTNTLNQNDKVHSETPSQPIIIQLGSKTQSNPSPKNTNSINDYVPEKSPSIIMVNPKSSQKKSNIQFTLPQKYSNIHIRTPDDHHLTPPMPVEININSRSDHLIPSSVASNPGKSGSQTVFTDHQQQRTLGGVNASKTPLGHQPNTINNSPRLDISSPPLVPAIAGTTTQCQLPDGQGTYTCISFENLHPENKHFSVHNSNRRSDLLPSGSRAVKKYALVKSKGNKFNISDAKQLNEKIQKTSIKNNAKENEVNQTHVLSSQPKIDYLQKYGYGHAPDPQIKSIENINEIKSDLPLIKENESEVLKTKNNKYIFPPLKPSKPTPHNLTRENILEKRKQKINAIIEKAVKRALKFKHDNNEVHKEIFEKDSQSRTSTTLRPSTKEPQEPGEMSTKQPNFAPILNPVTGKPIGVVSNANGQFFPVEPIATSTTESDIRSTTSIHDILETTENSSTTMREDPETTTGGYKPDMTPQIDPTLESLTREFMDLIQGEKSAISPPIYVR